MRTRRTSTRTKPALLLAAAAIVLAPETILACSVCMGNASGSGSASIGPAMNAAIFLLLTIVLSLGACFFAFLIYLAKRDNAVPLRPDAPFPTEMLTPLNGEGKTS